MLFKHFPTKSALYAEILAEECEADPALHELLGLEPSTETLVILVRGMVGHFMHVSDSPDQEEAQRLRLMVTSHLDDGEFARLLFEKIGGLIGPVFTASLDRAVAAGDASKVGREPLNLFWFAHHTVLMLALATTRQIACLDYTKRRRSQRQVCEFIPAIGLNETAMLLSDRELALIWCERPLRKYDMNIVTEAHISGKTIVGNASVRSGWCAGLSSLGCCLQRWSAVWSHFARSAAR